MVTELVEDKDAYSTLREFDYTTGNLMAIQPRGVVERYTRYGSGDVETRTDARGHVSRYQDYYRGVPRQETQPVDENRSITLSRVVNGTGTVKSETNGRSFTTNYQYDDLNRPVLVDRPLGADIEISWSETGRVVTRGAGRQQSVLDGFGRPICVDMTDAAQSEHVTRVARYDALGRGVFQSNPFRGECPVSTGSTVTGDTFSLDALGRATRIDHADGTFASIGYLPGNQVRVTNERGRQTITTYRSFGSPDGKERVLMRIDAPEKVTTVLTRDVLGNVLTATQGERDDSGNLSTGLVRIYGYDPANNYLLTENNPETGLTVYTRDGLGNMRSRQVGTSGPAQYTFDYMNRLVYIDYPGVTPDVTMTYDDNSNLTGSSSASGLVGSPNWQTADKVERSNIYDDNDRLTEEAVCYTQMLFDGMTLSTIEDKTLKAVYTYDDKDVLATIQYPSGQVVDFNPDGLGRPTQVSPFVAKVDYDVNGAPGVIHHGNGVNTSFEYNTRQWPQRITSGSASDLKYDYDGVGNVLSITDTLDTQRSRAMTYDDMDRLKTASGIWGSGDFGYDAVGNLRTKALGGKNLTYTYTPENLLLDVTGSQSYHFSYDTYGNVISNDRFLFTYDDTSNLRNVSGDASANYVYDGHNRRVRKAQGDKVTYYLYSKSGSLLGEYTRYSSDYKEYAYLGGKLVAMEANLNIWPVANAGVDQTVNEGATVQLDGSASYDSDGTVVGNSWAQTGGPSAQLNDAGSAKPAFTAPAVSGNGVLTFVLTVTDDEGHISTDAVNVTVLDMDLDNDGDGLPDSWENFYFGHTTHTGSDDPDGDGLTNLQEYREGTNPTVADPAPAPVAEISTGAGDKQATLAWLAVKSAAVYDLYWGNAPGVTPTTGTRIAGVTTPFTHAGLVNNQAYYYIVVARNNSGSSQSAEVRIVPGARSWAKAALVETTDGETTAPDVALDAVGNAVAVWTQRDGTAYTVQASRYRQGQGWAAQEVVVSSALGVADPHVAVDGNGNTVVVWRQSDGARYNLWARHYAPATGWSAALLLENYDGDGTNYNALGTVTLPRVVMNQQGYAMAAWLQETERYSASEGRSVPAMYAARYVPGGGWSERVMIDTTDVSFSYEPEVAIDATGNAVAVWVHIYYGNSTTPSQPYELSANRYTLGQGWGGPVLAHKTSDVPGYIKTSLHQPRVTMDSAGTATVAWQQQYSGANSPVYTTWTNRQTMTAPWAAATQLSDGRNLTDYPDIAAGPNGSALAVWTESGSKAYNVLARSFAAGTWTPATTVASDTSTYKARAALDQNGNGVALWCHSPGNTLWSLSASRYVGGVWSTATLLEDDDLHPVSCSTSYPDIAINPAGDAAAIWLQTDGTRNNLWAGLYRAPNSLPPIANAGPDQTVIQKTTVTLTGTASTDPDGTVVSHRWKQLSGPAVTLANAGAAVTSFTAPAVTKTTVAVFELTVTDNSAATATDTIAVTITK